MSIEEMNHKGFAYRQATIYLGKNHFMLPKKYHNLLYVNYMAHFSRQDQ